jgi:hypothetical protein|tara:strand:- start:161 stop:436 length:276 start_codon:yes stop_codon:yes gene_type:complete
LVLEDIIWKEKESMNKVTEKEQVWIDEIKMHGNIPIEAGKNSKTMKAKTMFTFKLLNLIKKCREKGKYDLYGKLIKKYNIDKEKLEEAYYD